MINLEPIFLECINQLPNIAIDANNACCIRFDVGDEVWKMHILYDSDTGECSVRLVRRDY